MIKNFSAGTKIEGLGLGLGIDILVIKYIRTVLTYIRNIKITHVCRLHVQCNLRSFYGIGTGRPLSTTGYNRPRKIQTLII
jgi:hypothetical protein